MKWEILTSILENAAEKVKSIKDVDERMAMLVFYVAEMVEANERNACEKLCSEMYLSGDMDTGEAAEAIRARCKQ